MLAFLKLFWKEIFIVLVIAGGVWYVRHLQSTVESQKTQIVNLSAENKVLQDNEVVLKGVIKSTKDSFAVIDKYHEKNVAQFDALQKSVNKSSATLTQRLDDILKSKQPKTCEETIQYLIDATKDYSAK